MREGYWGDFGGAFVSELLVPALHELNQTFGSLKENREFNNQFQELLHSYAGRPTPLTFCANLSQRLGGRIYLKREDLLHSGAHKINNALGQALIAKYMGKGRIIAETGAGQHGVATAMVAAKLGLQCDIYMGSRDMERQQLNVFRMQLFGATVIAVKSGSGTLKDAVSQALRDYTANSSTTHYLLGSALGPHPYPTMVAHFHRSIGEEAKRQITSYEGRLPSLLLACVGGGSNAIGLFQPFIDHSEVELIGIEAGGSGLASGRHAARLAKESGGSIGMLHGTKSYLLQDKDGQILETHSISAGLDYPAVGPQHAHLYQSGRAHYYAVDDDEALQATEMLCQSEGILPALESAHAVAWLKKMDCHNQIIIVNLSGRGDKDIAQIREAPGSRYG